MMNCMLSSHTYGSVLIFQRNKQNQPEDPDSLFLLKAWRVLKWTDLISYSRTLKWIPFLTFCFLHVGGDSRGNKNTCTSTWSHGGGKKMRSVNITSGRDEASSAGKCAQA